MNTLYESVLEEIESRGYKAVLKENSKNGCVKTCINIIDPESNVSPCIYLDDVVGTVYEIADKVIDIYEKSRIDSMDVNLFMNKDFFKKHLTVALQRKTEEKLIKKPYLEDMEQYLMLLWEDMSIRIVGEHLKLVEMSEEDAWNFAIENCKKSTVLVDMYELIDEIGIADELSEYEIERSEIPMAVIRSNNGFKGASGILNTELIEKFAERYGVNKVAFLPSSIHEGILVTVKDADNDLKALSEMVTETNELTVKEEEQLADRAYIIEV